MTPPLGDHHEAREVAVVVEQKVELYGALRPPELRPVEQRRAQIDHRGVQADELVFEPELPSPLAQRRTALQELVEHLLEQFPRAMGIGVRERRTRRRFGHGQVTELSLAARQTTADLAERMGTAKLEEDHPHELKPRGMALRVGPLDGGLELQSSLRIWLNMEQNLFTGGSPLYVPSKLVNLGVTLTQEARPVIPPGNLSDRFLILRRPQFLWTRICGEFRVQGG